MRPHRVFAALVLAGALVGSGPRAGAAVLISIDKAAQQMSVSVDGEPRWTWPVSTGRAGYDTPNGGYTAFRMVEDHYSREWDDAPMPHSIFFTQIGHAIHGTNQTKHLGQPASHGCVRLAPEHAAQLFALVKEQGLPNTKVAIDGELPPPPPPPPPVARSKPPAPPAAGRTPREDDRRPARSYATPNEYGVGPRGARDRSRQRAARAYAPPPRSYHRPPVFDRPPVYERRGARPGPRVYYDPRVEIIEETYVNGTWVRRRYYRQARPQDFHGYR